MESVVCALVGCGTMPQKAESADGIRAVIMSGLHGKKVKYLHVRLDASLEQGQPVAAGQQIGSVEPWPDTLSVENDRALKTATVQHDRREYAAAFMTLVPLFETEQGNPFFMYCYGRVVYWLKNVDQAAFEQLSSLSRKIEAENPTDDETTVIDMWFPDLYWKLATLYLDRRRYKEAVFELSRTLYFSFREGAAEMEQPLSYLAEAYYYLGDKKTNNFLVDYTKKQYPRNLYVDRFRIP